MMSRTAVTEEITEGIHLISIFEKDMIIFEESNQDSCGQIVQNNTTNHLNVFQLH